MLVAVFTVILWDYSYNNLKKQPPNNPINLCCSFKGNFCVHFEVIILKNSVNLVVFSPIYMLDEQFDRPSIVAAMLVSTSLMVQTVVGPSPFVINMPSCLDFLKCELPNP